jgi:hypothetical protein
MAGINQPMIVVIFCFMTILQNSAQKKLPFIIGTNTIRFIILRSGRYIVKYNFCEYRDKKLYLRYSDPSSKSKVYHYIEIPGNIRIHLHDYNNQMREGKTEEIKNNLEASVLVLKCEEWNLKKQDCR